MAKNFGVAYPERPLMSTISDLLGIPHFTTSNGGTVRSDFLREVLQTLGGEPAGKNKDQLIVACVEQATGATFDPALRSPGDTVTNRVLQTIVDGITERGLAIGAGPGTSNRPDPAFPQVDVEFDPSDGEDLRKQAVAARALREGQDGFRTMVLETYGYRCALTGSDAVSALEAAHITPYQGVHTNVISNGLCLRADIHRLWDSGLIAIDELSMTVRLGTVLLASTYRDLDGAPVPHLPRRKLDWPSAPALRAHRESCGL